MAKIKQEAQNPLILRSNRLIEAFAKSDDERDFYLDRQEGFVIYVDLDRPQNDLEELEKELTKNKEHYCLIPKLTYYETKKIMEGFVTEKVYDIDTKEKMLDIIQSKDARANFMEFLYDHHAELEKWQQFYQERSRIRIIEWLRQNHFHFVFEEDLELAGTLIDTLKHNLFETKVGKDIATARKTLVAKAKTYYSNEALNPRPKRGRPPKQIAKQEVEAQITMDVYLTVQPSVRPFIFTPDIAGSSGLTFSTKDESDEFPFSGRRTVSQNDSVSISLDSINQKLATLRTIAPGKFDESPGKVNGNELAEDWGDDDWDEDDDEDEDDEGTKKKSSKKSKISKQPLKKQDKAAKKPEKKVSPLAKKSKDTKSTKVTKPVKTTKETKQTKDTKSIKATKSTKDTKIKPKTGVKKKIVGNRSKDATTGSKKNANKRIIKVKDKKK